MKKLCLFMFAIMALMISFQSCSDDDDDAVKVESLTLMCDSVYMGVDSVYSMSVIISPADASEDNIKWASSDNAVATVDVHGIVTGVSAGVATITASANGVESSCKVVVNKSYFTIGTTSKVIMGAWRFSDAFALSTQIVDETAMEPDEYIYIVLHQDIVGQGVKDVTSGSFNMYYYRNVDDEPITHLDFLTGTLSIVKDGDVYTIIADGVLQDGSHINFTYVGDPYEDEVE